MSMSLLSIGMIGFFACSENKVSKDHLMELLWLMAILIIW